MIEIQQELSSVNEMHKGFKEKVQLDKLPSFRTHVIDPDHCRNFFVNALASENEDEDSEDEGRLVIDQDSNSDPESELDTPLMSKSNAPSTLIEKLPTVITQTPTVLRQTPTVLRQTPTVQRQNPTLLSQTSTVQSQTSTVLSQTSTVLRQTPTLLRQTPTVLRQTPTAITTLITKLSKEITLPPTFLTKPHTVIRIAPPSTVIKRVFKVITTPADLIATTPTLITTPGSENTTGLTTSPTETIIKRKPGRPSKPREFKDAPHRKRGRPALEVYALPVYPDTKTCPLKEFKHRLMRDRNNVASRLCRLARRKKQEALEQQVTLEENRREVNLAKISKLNSDIAKIRSILQKICWSEKNFIVNVAAVNCNTYLRDHGYVHN